MKFKFKSLVEDTIDNFAALLAALKDNSEVAKISYAPFELRFVGSEQNDYNGYDAVVITERGGCDYMFYLDDVGNGESPQLKIVFPCEECGEKIEGSSIKPVCDQCAHEAWLEEEATKQQAYDAWRRS